MQAVINSCFDRASQAEGQQRKIVKRAKNEANKHEALVARVLEIIILTFDRVIFKEKKKDGLVFEFQVKSEQLALGVSPGKQ